MVVMHRVPHKAGAVGGELPGSVFLSVPETSAAIFSPRTCAGVSLRVTSSQEAQDLNPEIGTCPDPLQCRDRLFRHPRTQT